VNDAETDNVGHVHFCFDVDDIQAERAGYKCLYFRTPDGHTTELAESHE
jgi:hypothetical protein